MKYRKPMGKSQANRRYRSGQKLNRENLQIAMRGGIRF